jgi:hypothetical protein
VSDFAQLQATIVPSFATWCAGVALSLASYTCSVEPRQPYNSVGHECVHEWRTTQHHSSCPTELAGHHCKQEDRASAMSAVLVVSREWD